MTATYQDVVRANGALASWALTEAGGTDFAPWLGGSHLVGAGGLTYRQAGPFATAFGLMLAVGASLRLSFLQTVSNPVTIEAWIKLASATPAAAQTLDAAGNEASNGTGVYIATNGHVHWIQGGISDQDLGVLWPSAAWHLLDVITTTAGTHTIAIDGLPVSTFTSATPNAPNPNVLGFLSSGNGGCENAASLVAYPTFYGTALSQFQTQVNFLAASDPVSALALVGGTGVSDSSLLQAIYDAVHKTY